ncbi:MAG TPA: hypothetical protein VGK73_31620 [Polyangiaceae bacterium]
MSDDVLTAEERAVVEAQKSRILANGDAVAECRYNDVRRCFDDDVANLVVIITRLAAELAIATSDEGVCERFEALLSSFEFDSLERNGEGDRYYIGYWIRDKHDNARHVFTEWHEKIGACIAELRKDKP